MDGEDGIGGKKLKNYLRAVLLKSFKSFGEAIIRHEIPWVSSFSATQILSSSGLTRGSIQMVEKSLHLYSEFWVLSPGFLN